MNIEKKVTITLSETDVKDIIAAYLLCQGYQVSPDNVELVVSNKWVGYGRDEHQVPYFKECTAKVTGD